MKFVKHFDANPNGKDYVVGDLHGCYDDLKFVLKKIGFDKSCDRLFSVGDLIDRGPKNMECLALMYEPWFHLVRGNHEQMMIDCLANNNQEMCGVWLYNGGLWMNEQERILIEDIAKTLNELPYVIVIGEGENRINIVHAEILSATDVDIDNLNCFDQKGLDEMIWGRNLIMHASHFLTPEQMEKFQQDLSLTICGHTPVRLATRVCNQLFIDGGCVYHHINTNKTSHDHRLIVYDIHSKQVLEYIPAIGEILETPLDKVKRIP